MYFLFENSCSAGWCWFGDKTWYILNLIKLSYDAIVYNFMIFDDEGAGNPFVKITYDKQKAKTEPVKASVDLSWKEFFFLYKSFSSYFWTVFFLLLLLSSSSHFKLFYLYDKF
jgi:hypothetical protein